MISDGLRVGLVGQGEGLMFGFTRGWKRAKPAVARRVQRRVSEVIGPLPQIAPKKHN